MTCWHYLAAGLIAGLAVATVISVVLWAAAHLSGRHADAETPCEE